MPSLIGVKHKVRDTRSDALIARLVGQGIAKGIQKLVLADLYSTDFPLTKQELQLVGPLLANPVSQSVVYSFRELLPPETDWVIEIGFLPGVTDNIANTAKETIADRLNRQFDDDQGLYSSQLLFFTGTLSKNQVQRIAEGLANPLIQRLNVMTASQFQQRAIQLPKVNLQVQAQVDQINLEISDPELVTLGKQGIKNDDGSYRGPLALDLVYLKAIQAYFKKQKRQPTDIELESIAQTWSEHCKHTIFADPIDELKGGLYRTLIKGATNKIRKKQGKNDICVSVFTDNAGAIIFDDDYLVTHKVETHNSPSALDPFGGAITGIVGVNRDAIGFGLGAKPIINTYGFCLGYPDDQTQLFRDAKKLQPLFPPRRIMEGVIAGVNVGGNCSGIPTPQGFLVFDDRFKGKPLVFVGTVGLIPKTENRRSMVTKAAQPGDLIVMVGGRVGLDGIHGATFSSEALNTGSPATAVQIGDPITQKKMSDALVKEARQLNLYTSITDNGAGGLSCSVAEMAKESGGCKVDLEKVPLKYPGLAPWQIWISESQERMTLSVAPAKWPAFESLMRQRGVEATVIGQFTMSGRCIVKYNDKTIMDLEMEFLHDGLPPRKLVSKPVAAKFKSPKLPTKKSYSADLLQLLARPNLAGFSFLSSQYDHEVQGGSVLKPLQGRGRINAEVSVTKPRLDSQKAVAISQGVLPTYGDHQMYDMAAAAIDTAIRNLVAVGANPDKIALLDNFCWCSSNQPERLAQLKDAVQACYDYAIAYQTPFISGKDSMFNDFKGFDQSGQPIQISILPTLLISSISVLESATQAISIDFKQPGDLLYLLGELKEEFGGSEYLQFLNQADAGLAPKVDAKQNQKLYQKVYQANQSGILSSAIGVNRGGLSVALAKSCMAAGLGASAKLAWQTNIGLFAESQGCILVSIAPAQQKQFTKQFAGTIVYFLGEVTQSSQMTIIDQNNLPIIKASIDDLLSAYRSTFKDY